MAYEHDPDHNSLQAVLDAGAALAEPRALLPGDNPSLIGVLVPAGADFKQVDLEKFLPAPRRKTGAAQLATAQSFIDWVNRNKTPETVILACELATSFKAIFNGHAANQQPFVATDGNTGAGFVSGAPGWGDFHASYGCPLSDEWKRWMKHSQHEADQKKGMGHQEFLQFIEDNLLDIIRPDNARMLMALQRFQARREVTIQSGRRLDNGDLAFAYSEDTQQVVKEGQSDLILPSQFTLSIPVFKGGIHYEVDANLRHRAGAHGLVLWYELVRPHKSLEHAFNSVSEQIRNGTSVPMFNT